MTNELLEYWKKFNQDIFNYSVIEERPDSVIIRVFETIREDDRTWVNTWLEECVRGIAGNHEIYHLSRKKLK